MKASVIVFPDSNCDRDVQVALAEAIGAPVEMVWHGDSEMAKTDLIVLPGGFSYGDYLRCGAMSARSPIMREVVARAEQGVAVLGICNGFQVLLESGLLPGALMRNDSLEFRCEDVHLAPASAGSPFTGAIDRGRPLRMPISHGEGNYYADDATLDALEAEQRVAFRYVDAAGRATAEANPNGSLRNIAGVYNETKTILGLMPHPERLADAALGGSDGAAMFQGLVEALS